MDQEKQRLRLRQTEEVLYTAVVSCAKRATEHSHALKQGVLSYGFRIVSAVHLQLSKSCGRDEGSGMVLVSTRMYSVKEAAWMEASTA